MEQLQHDDPNRLYWEVELTKATKDEATGNYVVEGIANTGKKDEQDEELVPVGMDLSYLLKKGHIKWEHHNQKGLVMPVQYVGEPTEARITPEGFYLKGLLYGHHKLTPQIIEQMETLEKSGSSRRMGFSIEGQALARDPKNPGKVTKSVIRNVALTMNPVDSGTWARLVKSLDLSDPDAIDWDLEKTLTTESAAPIMPESLEGGLKQPDPYADFAHRVRLVVGRWLGGMHRELGLKKSISALTPEAIATDLYLLAENTGAGTAVAEEASRFGFDRADMLKSLALKLAGGELGMSDLAKSLGADLEELMKSAEGTHVKPEPESEPEAEPEAEPEVEEEQEWEPEDDEATEPESEEEPEEDDDEEKSFRTDLVKSNTEAGAALEVSEFLDALVQQVGLAIDSFEGTLTKSLTNQRTFNTDQHTFNLSLAKSLSTMGKAFQHVMAENEALKTLVTEQGDLIKSMATTLDAIAGAPMGRRGVVDPREIQTMRKSITTGAITPSGDSQPSSGLTKSMVLDRLVDAAIEGKIDRAAVTNYELHDRLDLATARAAGIEVPTN